MPDLQVTGVAEVVELLGDIASRVERVDAYIAEKMVSGMRDVVHIQSGYLQSTIHTEGPYAVADAPYAGFEADRGGSHDFPALAEQNLDIDEIADWLVPE